MRTPTMYIVYFDKGNEIKLGPYHTISANGFGVVIGQNWVSYKVQGAALTYDLVTVPTIHYITTL